MFGHVSATLCKQCLLLHLIIVINVNTVLGGVMMNDKAGNYPNKRLLPTRFTVQDVRI